MFPTKRQNLAQQVDTERKKQQEQTIGMLRGSGDATDVPSRPVQTGTGPVDDPAGEAMLNANDADGDEAGALVPRDPHIPEQPGEEESTDKIVLFKGESLTGSDINQREEVLARHRVLMACLEEEAERQSEERRQAQIDHEYYDHQQWTAEEARVLQERGQAPLVFNEARGSIDWLAGTERRLRKDYKIRPREKGDEQIAELKTNVFKYVDDVNLAPWHRSRAFKQTAISGLGWLEEGVTTDPERELIYSGSEDWRRVFRDSRGREFDQSDWRFILRRKVIDVDYACALLPGIANHLISNAGRWGTDEDEADDVWYLGQRLTSAHSHEYMMGNDGIYGGDYTVRRAGYGAFDPGRRNSVELIEAYYRVPERVKVFSDGPQYRKIVNGADPRHQQLLNDKWGTYETVKWRMRVMVGTRHLPGWDGPSPFHHGQFPLIPMFGYRRGRDGMTYGSMRGMRDPQDDLNKRRSKALHLLSANRVVIKKDAVDDLEEARVEVARADMMLEVDDVLNVKFEKPVGEASQNLEMAESDRIHIRNAGGVTGDNLGQESNAISGKAIIAKQEQGSLTSFELFDNYLLAFKLAGQRRMANIEQFCNQEWTIRIDPEGAGLPQWHTVNQFDPRTGQHLNDITASQADFIVDQQDYRATLSQSAMQSMFELLGQIATFAPQAVLSLLDLVVDSADIKGKAEWVKRIRQINGQTDPSKPPTPEEQAAMQKRQAQADEMDQLNIATVRAKLGEVTAKIDKTNAERVLANLTGLMSAVGVATAVSTVPALAPAADSIAKSAGYQDATPATPVVPMPAAAAVPPQAAMPQPGAAPAMPEQPAPGQPGQPAPIGA